MFHSQHGLFFKRAEKGMVMLETLEARRFLSTYWVKTSGDDANAGTESSPYATIQHGLDQLHAGDQLFIGAGDYAGASRFTLQGTQSAPILIEGVGDVNIVSRAAAQPDVPAGLELSGFDAASGCKWITVRNLEFRNIGEQLGTGCRIRFSDHITVERCYSHDNGWVGFYAARVTNYTIQDCVSESNNTDPLKPGHHGFYVAQNSTDCTILRCVSKNNNGNGLHINGDGGTNRRFLISENQVIGGGVDGGSGINCDGLSDSTIIGNAVYKHRNKGLSLYTIDGLQATNNLIANNLLVVQSGNATLQLQNSGNTVNNNLVYQYGSGVALENTANNTFNHNGYKGAGFDFGNNYLVSTGDANGDGQVIGDDYTVVDANFGRSPRDNAFVALADVNNDELVTGDDYTVIDSNL